MVVGQPQPSGAQLTKHAIHSTWACGLGSSSHARSSAGSQSAFGTVVDAATHEKFAASFVSPVPPYLATWPNGQRGRVRSTFPSVR